MKRVVLAVVVFAACGSKPAEPPLQPPPHPPLNPPPACTNGELVEGGRCVKAIYPKLLDAIAEQSKRLVAVATTLHGADVLDRTSAELATRHALAAWQRAAAKAPAFRPLEPERLARSRAAIATLEERFTKAAKLLDDLHDELAAVPGTRTLESVRGSLSQRLAQTFESLGAAVTATVKDDISPLSSLIVDETVLLRDAVCVRPADRATRAACELDHVTSEALEYVHRAGPAARQGFDAAGAAMADQLGDLLDARARLAIDKAIGRGPSYGAPCGAEDLCANGLRCVDHGARTCERRCDEAAMQPCPNRTRCLKIEGLGTTCRP